MGNFCARSYILRLYETERRLNLYLEGVYLIHMFLGVFRPLGVILNQLMANEVANTLSMRAFFNIFQSWVSQIQISCIEALPFYMPKIIIQDAVSQITDINHLQITCKEALPFYMPKMIIQDAVLFSILNNRFRHARRQSFFVSNLYL